ncbi:uncharacterized protein LOC110990368 [Acanthaster planci]|uniref:Uncharacterized protein LOC110990368 n=1 Tax=Acanthaster planci TaxID=133434 RepID=A0A8B8A035_ACAPL|nr:uncharacterized protein LOC110990368 [Acanthaster planci]
MRSALTIFNWYASSDHHMMHYYTFIGLMFLCGAVLTAETEVSLQEGPRNTSVIEGKTVIMKCVFRQLNPFNFVYWYRNETDEIISLNDLIGPVIDQDRQKRYRILSDSSTSNFTLKISDVRVTDAGTYSCGIFKDFLFKKQAHLATAKLTVKPNQRGNSSSIPTCTLSTSYVTAYEQHPKLGDLVYLKCLRDTEQDFEGSLRPELIWYKKFSDDAISQPRQEQTQLSILLSPEDNGVEFTCKLQYPDLGDLGREVGGECSITPLSIPPSSWIKPSGRVRVVENSEVVLTCNGTGVPAVTEYQWRIHPQIPKNWYDVEEKGRILRIKNFKKEDGSLNVTCLAQIASGLTGDESSSTMLIMIETMKVTNDTFFNKNTSTTTTLPAVIIPIIIVSLLVMLLVVICKYTEHKRKRNISISSSPEHLQNEENSTSSSQVVPKPSPLPPRLAHYDYPSTSSSFHFNSNYTSLEATNDGHNDYLDLTGKDHQPRTDENEYTDYLGLESATTTSSPHGDVSVYETYEIP